MCFLNKLIVLSLALSSIVVLMMVSVVFADTVSPNYTARVSLSSLAQEIYRRQPGLLNQSAQQQQITANSQRANALFADSSIVGIRHQNDVVSSNIGLQEWESNIHMPLWLPGQKQQQRYLSEKMAAYLPAYQQKLQLDSSGMVRELIWNVLLADNINKQAFQAWQTAKKLEHDVAARVKSGEFARAEGLLASTNTLEKKRQYQLSQAELTHALTSYQHYTGTIELPQQYEETLQLNDADEPTQQQLIAMVQNHPYLQLMDQYIATLIAKQGMAQYDGAINPTLLVGMRRERAGDNERFINSLGVGITFALDNKVHRAPAIANASKDVADAEIARQTRERELVTDLFAKIHDLQTKQAELAIAIDYDDTTQRYFALQQRAFELGELDLVNVLRSQQVANESHNRRQRLTIEIKQLVAEVNQALGVLL